jgi:hypothetical protein
MSFKSLISGEPQVVLGLVSSIWTTHLRVTCTLVRLGCRPTPEVARQVQC